MYHQYNNFQYITLILTQNQILNKIKLYTYVKMYVI